MKRHKQAGLDGSKPRFSSAAAFSAAATFLFTLICFFPNPALPIGASTGLQAGQAMALLSLPVILVLGLPRRQTLALLLLVLPVLLSGFLAVLTGYAISDDVALKSMVAILLVMAVLVPVGGIVAKRYMAPLLTGVASAIVLHAALGLYQIYSFARDVFPLSGLYQNPSFINSISKEPQVWATYVKRPFGLFPEPSAMSASIGPWLLLIVGLLLYPRLRRGMTRGNRILLVAALVGGIGLILLSSSGFTTWLLAGLLLVALPTLKDKVLRLYRPESLLTLVALALVGAALVILSVIYLGSRLDIGENSSWSARLASIVWGFSYLGTSPTNLLFGVGPGQSYLILKTPGALSELPGVSGEVPVTAVWSTVVAYVQETGLLGALALALILIMVLRAILRSSARVVGLGCLVAWLAGVVFTTSYLPLSPIWLFLGVLLGWDRIFEVRAASKILAPKPVAPPVRSVVKT